MKTITWMMAACLACAMPLAQACEHEEGCGGEEFKALDKNGDGFVSKKEFDAYHNALFKKMDANKDGKLSREEMEGTCDTKREKDECDTSFDRRFDEVDINHDGGLSKDEAEIGMPMLFKHFDEIDSNKDGKITKDEIMTFMEKLHEKMHGKLDKINEAPAAKDKP